MQPSDLEQENRYRQHLWKQLIAEGGPEGVTPTLLRKLHLYDGQAGIWTDKSRTSSLTEDGEGLTLSLLHNGVSYPDDLSEDALIYHYPTTKRRGHDRSEVEATKAVGKLNLPLFVISHPTLKSKVRDVQQGWIIAWDDHARIFLVSLGAKSLQENTAQADGTSFQMQESSHSVPRLRAERQGQPKFKFRVIERYGLGCALCNITLYDLMEVAHICPKSARGSDDPRNGLLLCPLHHRAWDVGLFAIDPYSLEVVGLTESQTLSSLHIERSSLQHLARKPHTTALEWRWSRRK